MEAKYHLINVPLFLHEFELRELHDLRRQVNETLSIEHRVFHSTQQAGRKDGL